MFLFNSYQCYLWTWMVCTGEGEEREGKVLHNLLKQLFACKWNNALLRLKHQRDLRHFQTLTYTVPTSSHFSYISLSFIQVKYNLNNGICIITTVILFLANFHGKGKCPAWHRYPQGKRWGCNIAASSCIQVEGLSKRYQLDYLK